MKVAFTGLLAFTAVVNAAAHPKVDIAEAEEIEKRDLGAFFGSLSSLLASIASPATTSSAKSSSKSTSTVVVVTSTSSAKTTSTISSSANKSTGVVVSSVASSSSTKTTTAAVVSPTASSSTKSSTAVVASSSSTKSSSTSSTPLIVLPTFTLPTLTLPGLPTLTLPGLTTSTKATSTLVVTSSTKSVSAAVSSASKVASSPAAVSSVASSASASSNASKSTVTSSASASKGTAPVISSSTSLNQVSSASVSKASTVVSSSLTSKSLSVVTIATSASKSVSTQAASSASVASSAVKSVSSQGASSPSASVGSARSGSSASSATSASTVRVSSPSVSVVSSASKASATTVISSPSNSAVSSASKASVISSGTAASLSKTASGASSMSTKSATISASSGSVSASKASVSASPSASVSVSASKSVASSASSASAPKSSASTSVSAVSKSSSAASVSASKAGASVSSASASKASASVSAASASKSASSGFTRGTFTVAPSGTAPASTGSIASSVVSFSRGTFSPASSGSASGSALGSASRFVPSGSVSRSISVASASSSTQSVPYSTAPNGSVCPIPRISRSKTLATGSAVSATGTSSITSSTSTSTSTTSTTDSSATSVTSTSSIVSTDTATSTIATDVSSTSVPSVTLTAGTVLGTTLPSGIDQFLGIPYAQPPVNDLRLRAPQPLLTPFGLLNATTPPPSCPQFAQTLTGNQSAGGLQSFINEFVFTPTVQQEDCLTVSIWRPQGLTATSKLPVVFWMYGGGFQFGATAMYNGTEIVQRSITNNAPIIFIEVNYRVGGFGFLAGSDLAGEHNTNLGLRDQRLGLQWAADNIGAFGGDSSKVTLWGESAGAISSCYQLTVNGGNNMYNGQALFRGSIHDSGAFAPAENVTARQAQAIYDQVVAQTGCTADTAAARLACLRTVDYDTLHNATNSVPGFGGYSSIDLPYLPRPDTGDTFYSQSAEFSVAAGQWTKTPFIIGDQQDEGTLFAVVQNNITNNDQLIDYLTTYFPGDANARSDVAGLVALYPDNPDGGQPDGSPFNTGSANNIYPEYKRLAAILGDISFIITRRAFLNLGTGQGVNAWTYISTYLQGLATYGTLHGSDLAYLFDPLFAGTKPTQIIQNYYINFINNLDPNVVPNAATAYSWPSYNMSTPIYAEFTGGDPVSGNDTFRSDVYEYLLAHVIGLRL